MHFDSHAPFDTMFKSNIRNFLAKRQARMNSSEYERIIVIDDGGEVLDQIDDFIVESDRVVGIEQTSSGYNKLKFKDHQIPIINLARAEAKKVYETPFIVEGAIRLLSQRFEGLRKRPEKILIMGQGVLGRRARELLSAGYKVDGYDIVEEKSDMRAEDLHRRLGEYDVVIGCTGTTSLTAEQHGKLKKGCTLISISSPDREFDAVHLRRQLAVSGQFCRDVEVDGIKLLNSGFPINFNAQEETESLEMIQLTRALILGSILQATRPQRQTGFIELDRGLQFLIADQFQRGVMDVQDVVVSRPTYARLPAKPAHWKFMSVRG